jgi:DNA-directed RNA polymerase subunit M/transcription elongation factor TFIIS
MPIQFACPSCARGYSVKDELAGKSAKCGQCGHKMKIPSAATKAAASTSAAKSIAAKPAAAKVTAPSAARVTTAKAPATDPGTSSWLDEELETARVEAKAKPMAPPSDMSCPSCNGPMMPGAVICVKCGYDKRIRGRRSVEHVDEDAAAPKRSKLGHMGSLLRGSFFSFLGAMLGAILWAVLCYLTMYEFSIVAWGLGGLAGLGMALGH